MKSGFLKIAACILVLGLGFSGVSCSKEKTTEVTKKPPAGHDKMLEEFRQRSIEESKKIVVAKVNGINITMKELIDVMNQLGPLYKNKPGESSPEIDEKIKQEALELLIFRELALQEAKRKKLKVDPKVVDQEITQLKESLGSYASYKEYVERSGHTEETFRKLIEEDNLVQMITLLETTGKSKVDGQPIRRDEIERGNAWEAELKKKAKIEILEIQDVIPVSELK